MTAPLPFVPDAVLLDMDGLLLESERALLECWRQAAAERAPALDDALWLSMVGVHEAACRAMVHDRLPAAEADALLDRANALYAERVAAGLPRKAGVDALLDWLDATGTPRAIATSTLRDRAEAKLRAAGLRDRVQALVTGSDVRAPKPDPETYLRAAAALGVDPARCVAFEDSVPGVRAALAAGAVVVQVPDLVAPDAAVRALGHRIVPSLHVGLALLRAARP